MLRIPTIPIIVCAAVFGAACDEVTDPAGPLPGPAEALVLSAPSLTRADLTSVTYVGTPSQPDAGGIASGPALADAGYDELSRPLQQIFDADTRVRFEGGYAYSLGVHEYVGNVGRVETVATVSEGRQEIGEAQAARQDYIPFLADLGRRKSIWVQARVNTDVDCGLTVRGGSTHKASWQFFQGTGVSTWGLAERSTDASATQSGCARATASGTLAEDGEAGTLCYYYITYDVNTLEILSADFLYCTGAQGDML